MVRLPLDIQLSIFSLLITRDKLECMTVCRQWHDTIQHHSLFRSIYVDRQEQLDQLIKKVKSDPILGKSTERITLQLNLDSDYDADIFVELFPNLRHFALINANNSACLDPKSILSRSGHPWCGQMKSIIESMSDLNTKTLLRFGLCYKLTSIAVTGKGRESIRGFVELLSNAPALKTLHLNKYTITFLDIELLHETVPALESLLLTNTRIGLSPFPDDIKPASSIKSFQIVSCDFSAFRSFNLHVQYIRHKYTHLEELELDIEELDDLDEEGVNSLARQKAEITSCFKQLSPRLKNLSITTSSFEYDRIPSGFDFESLSICECRIETLEIGDVIELSYLYMLSMSTQVNYIRSLTVHGIHNAGGVIQFDWLKDFKVLKGLSLECFDLFSEPGVNSMMITDMLEGLGDNRLEMLRLDNIHLTFQNSDSTKDYNYPWLKELTLSKVTMKAGTDRLISQTFPDLKRLKLENCFGANGDRFKLPNTNLAYLEIVNNEVNDEHFPVLIITLKDGRSQVYNSRARAPFVHSYLCPAQKEIHTMPFVSNVQLDKSKNTPLLTIICKSVYDVCVRLNKSVGISI